MKRVGNKGKLKWAVSALVSFLAFLLLQATADRMRHAQEDQLAAERWSVRKNVAQISAFFSQDADVNPNDIISFEHTLDSLLLEASIEVESENPGARLWADAYSASGKIEISNEQTSVDVNAIGIGGDFFLFHPLKLVSGAYFSGNEVNKDYCVIDEETAWQLFGSSNVAGMIVYVGRRPLMITGVVEKPQGKLEKAAGLTGTLVFVSYEVLAGECGEDGVLDIDHYEIVMPDPVSGFALQKVQENLGPDETEAEYLQNTDRYSLKRCLELLSSFGTRSMNGRAILYPYWENLARGYEDILTLLLFVMLALLLYTVLVVLILFILWWRNKGWTIKSVCYKLKDRLERMGEKRYARRQEKKVKKKREKEESL